MFEKARKAYEKALELEPKNALIKQNYELFKEINDRASRRNDVASVLAALAARARLHRLRTRSRSRRRSSRSSTSPVPAGPRRRVRRRRHATTSTRTSRRCACCAASSATSRPLRVIEADVAAARRRGRPTRRSPAGRRRRPAVDHRRKPLPKRIKDEKDLEAYDDLFANDGLLEEARRGVPEPADRHRHGPVHAARTHRLRAAGAARPSTRYGRRTVEPVRTYMERKGFILRPKFIFIDGRTGARVHSETFREEVLYNPNQDTPALSSYFELMDRLIPSFLEHAEQPEDPRACAILLK